MMNPNNFAIHEEIVESKDKPKKINAPFIHSASASITINLMPPPEILESYEKFMPGSAERIFRMIEIQGEHRREIEKRQIEIEEFQAKSNTEIAHKEMFSRFLGQWMGFGIFIGTLAAGFIFTWLGKPIVGTIFSGTGLASILGLFIWDKFSFRKK